jgi:ABC-2 type transport system ATP-binding protein
VADHRRAADVLTAAGRTVTVHDDHLVVGGVSDAALISQTLGEAGLWVTELTAITPDLESVFLTLTGTMPEPGVHRQVDDSIRPAQPEPATSVLNVTGG